MTTYPLQFGAATIFHEIAALSRRYCDLIDTAGQDRQHWLREVSNLLPRLQAAISSAQVARCAVDRFDPIDLDARFELFSYLRRLLADRDSYWLEFDCANDGEGAMTGSLADDLTDIYCELKHGLLLFELAPQQAIAAWSNGYDRHWGQHLIDAERHLAMLEAQARLDR